MPEPIYKIWLAKPKEAYFQLSPEERKKLMDKAQEALKAVGAELVVGCYSVWSSENYLGFGLEKFPDYEAVRKHTQILLAMDWHRYTESTSYLGTETP